MLSHSLNEVVRKGAWTCVSCSKLSWICQVQAASPSRLLLARTHQRNHSSKPSSKSSNPSKDMPRALDATSKAPVNEVTPAMKPDSVNEVTPVMKPDNEKRPSTRTTRRKSGDITQEATGKTKDESLPSIPSVPSTQHLHPQGLSEDRGL